MVVASDSPSEKTDEGPSIAFLNKDDYLKLI